MHHYTLSMSWFCLRKWETWQVHRVSRAWIYFKIWRIRMFCWSHWLHRNIHSTKKCALIIEKIRKMEARETNNAMFSNNCNPCTFKPKRDFFSSVEVTVVFSHPLVMLRGRSTFLKLSTFDDKVKTEWLVISLRKSPRKKLCQILLNHKFLI